MGRKKQLKITTAMIEQGVKRLETDKDFSDKVEAAVRAELAARFPGSQNKR